MPKARALAAGFCRIGAGEFGCAVLAQIGFDFALIAQAGPIGISAATIKLLAALRTFRRIDTLFCVPVASTRTVEINRDEIFFLNSLQLEFSETVCHENGAVLLSATYE